MTDFTNEFDLHDSLDRSVAIATAADISAKIKDLQADLKWFSDGFRKLFHGGATETGAKGAMVKVNVPKLRWILRFWKPCFPFPNFRSIIKGTLAEK